MKSPRYMSVVSVINVTNEVDIELPNEERFFGENITYYGDELQKS